MATIPAGRSCRLLRGISARASRSPLGWGQVGQLDELAFRGLHRPAVIDQFAGDMLHHLYLIGGLRDGGVAVGDVLPAHAGHAFFHDGGALPLVVACRLRHIQLGVCHGGGDEQQAC